MIISVTFCLPIFTYLKLYHMYKGSVIIISEMQLNLTSKKSSSIVRLKRDGTRAETRFRPRRNGRVHLNRRGRQFSLLLTAEVCASALVMLDTPRSDVA